MAINLDRLATKLGALRGKDVNQIVADRVYIPFLGDSYNANRLQNWLRKLTGVLEDIASGAITEDQAAAFVANRYAGLSNADRAIVDSDNPDWSVASNESAADDMRLILLYRYLTSP